MEPEQGPDTTESLGNTIDNGYIFWNTNNTVCIPDILGIFAFILSKSGIVLLSEFFYLLYIFSQPYSVTILAQ